MTEVKYQFNVKKGEKNFVLSFSPDSTLGELFDVVSDIKNDIVSRIIQNNEAEKKLKEEKIEPIEDKQDV